jgi:hypothetical protein
VNALDSLDTIQLDTIQLDTLQLDVPLVFEEDVNPLSTIKMNVFALYRQAILELKCDPVAAQLMSEALLVGRLEQYWSELPVNFDGTADHAIRKLVEFHLRALRVLRGSFRSTVLFSILRSANVRSKLPAEAGTVIPGLQCLP